MFFCPVYSILQRLQLSYKFGRVNSLKKTIASPKNPILIWFVGVSFLLFQFFLQLSSGIIISTIMQEQALSALLAGILSSSFYYIYTSLQIPVGILFDNFNTRTLLFVNALLCSFGCFIFALSTELPMLFLGRIIIGAGSAFAFIGMSNLVREHFPLRQYAFIIGLSETLGFIITVAGMIGLATTIQALSWRTFIFIAGIIGIGISCLCAYFIPNNTPKKPSTKEYSKHLISILSNKFAWINGLFVCFEFSVITVYGALWAVPFLQTKLGCSLQVASTITSMVFLGAGVSCPIFGKCAVYFTKRKPLIHFSCLVTALLMFITLYLPTSNLILIGMIQFLIGLCCGAYMLSYQIANELSPPQSLAAGTGFTNTLAMLSAPLLQPLVGYLLDMNTHNNQPVSVENYQHALLIIPILLILASVLSQLLPEKQGE